MCQKSALSELVRLLRAGFRVERIQHQGRDNEAAPFETTVEVRKEHQDGSVLRQITSVDTDYVSYCFSLHQSLDENGDSMFKRFKDSNRYWTEMQRLTQEGDAQRRALGERVNRGEKLPGGLKHLLIEYLKTRDWGAPRFLPLKERYYELELSMIWSGRSLIESQKKLIASYPESKDYVEQIERLLNVVWNADSTFLKRAIRFFDFAELDVGDVFVRAGGQRKHVDDMMTMLAQRKGVPGDVGLPYLLDAYRRLSESIRPFVFTLDAAVRIAEEMPKAGPRDGFSTRVDNIKKTKWAPMVKCLDPEIRHAESHDSTQIDHANGRVLLTEVIDGKRTTMKEYSYWEIADIANELQRGLMPALLGAFAVHEAGLLASAIKSSEFINALLSIDNVMDWS